MRISSPVLLALFAAVVAVSALPSVGEAARISGRITDETGSPRDGMEVRLWADPYGKAWTVTATTTSNASGDYSFDDISAGRYLVDSRLPDGVNGTLADRWFDIVAPIRDGWAGFAADILVLETSTNLGSIDVSVPAQGGLSGSINIGELWVRIDNPAAIGFERNQFTRGNGKFVMGGLLVGGGYRLLAYDPRGIYATQIQTGPFIVNFDRTNDIGTFEMSRRPDDPYEPNDSPERGLYYRVDTEIFHGENPDVFITEGAYIGPRGEDVDSYCVDAQDHDRFLAYSVTDLGIPGEVTENPWMDPMLRFITSSGEVLDENDDAPGFGMNAAVDSGDIARGGIVCLQVTTFGDTAWDGSSQQTAGDYAIVIELGNRSPSVDLIIGESIAPPPPGMVLVAEGTLLRVDIDAHDPDGDPIEAWLTHVDAARNTVDTGTFEISPDGRGSYIWTIPEDGARHAPYEITLTVSDGEFEVSKLLLVSPRAENLPPEMPELLAPTDGSSVDSHTPTLQVTNATDPDGDTLTYEFEIHYGDPSAAPDETAHVGGDPSGVTSYVTRAIEENQRVSWRARARDGALTGGTSAWTEYWEFVVNVDNEVPTSPTLVKPDEGATVPHRTPTLSAENSTDGDGDTVSLIFEIATDTAFETIVRTSEPVEQNLLAGRTSWTVDPELEWGGEYYARVYATDPAGGVSDYSNTRSFRVKSNLGPEPPVMGGPFTDNCGSTVYDDGPPTQFVIPAVVDPEGEAVQINMRIYEDGADYELDDAVFATTFEQEAFFEGEHVIEVEDPSIFEENTRYVIRLQATDGFEVSNWAECSFWVRGEELPPGALTILEPSEGEVLAEDTASARVRISNAVDPNGDPLTIMWCAQIVDAAEGCAENIDEWNATPQDESGETQFGIEGVFPGAEILLRACAREPAGTCGPEASVTFSIDKSPTSVTPSLCACNVTVGPRRDTAGWLLLWSVVLVAMRRRPRR